MKNRETPKPKELVVMSWGGAWGEALSRAVSGPFTRETGIPVRHERHIGLKLPPALVEALDGGRRPPFDVVWSNAVPALRAAAKGGAEPLDEECVPNLKVLHPRANPAEGGSSWPVVSPYIVHYVMAYCTDSFPKGKPDTWEVMLEKRFKEKIALYPGGNGFYPIAQVLGGGSVGDIPQAMNPCWEFLSLLKPQVGRLDYSIGMGEQIRRGELKICFRSLPNALAFRNEGLDVSWTAPKEGISDTADALWIPKNVPEDTAVWSKRYIDFALSEDVQKAWCALLGALPMNRRAAVPPIFGEARGLPESLDDFRGVLHVSDALKVRYEENWEAHFNEIFS